MIKRGFVLDRVIDFTTGTRLPPLNVLPRWPRDGALNKSRFPRPFVKDAHFLRQGTAQSSENNICSKDDLEGTNPSLRIEHLERSIDFIRSQHSEILTSLHKEIDKLKRDNNELQLKMIVQGNITSEEKNPMHEINQFNALLNSSHRAIQISNADAATRIPAETSPEDETRILRQTVNDSKLCIDRQQQIIDKLETENQQLMQAAARRTRPSDQERNDSEQLNSVKQKVAEGSQTTSGNVLTINESESIIKHLLKTNKRLSRELELVKCELRDLMYSQKWANDAYAATNVFTGDYGRKDVGFPLIRYKKRTEHDHDWQGTVKLPALTQSVGKQCQERRKKVRILQKARLNRDIRPINRTPISGI